MNKEILVKLKEAKSSADAEKAEIDALYGEVWGQIIKEYRIYCTQSSTGDYYSKPLKASIETRIIDGRLTVEGSRILLTMLEKDGFKCTQLPYTIVFDISPEKIDEIISSSEKSGKGPKR